MTTEAKRRANLAYYYRHRERILAERKERYRANPEKHLVYCRKWRTERRDDYLQWRRENRKKNRERINQQARLYRMLYPERFYQRRQRDYLKHREKRLASVRRYYLINREAINERNRQSRITLRSFDYEIDGNLVSDRMEYAIAIKLSEGEQAKHRLDSLREGLTDEQNTFLDVFMDFDFDMTATSEALGITPADCFAIMAQIRTSAGG